MQSVLCAQSLAVLDEADLRPRTTTGEPEDREGQILQNELT
jgi:hypothetical protein